MFNCELKSCIKLHYTEDYFNGNHTHPYYELVYYYEGEGTVTIHDVPYAFSGGSFAVTQPEQYHNERGGKDTKLIYIAFSLTNEIELQSGLFEDTDGKIGKLMSECSEELQGHKNMFELVLNNLAERIVLHLLRRKPDAQSASEADSFSYILNYVDMNSTLNISVKEIAKRIGYNYNYFRELFFQHVGVSVKEYLLNKKIECAKRLLTSTDYSLARIASMSGFSSASHLCMVFKEKLQTTPLAYSEQFKQEYDVTEQRYLPTE